VEQALTALLSTSSYLRSLASSLDDSSADSVEDCIQKLTEIEESRKKVIQLVSTHNPKRSVQCQRLVEVESRMGPTLLPREADGVTRFRMQCYRNSKIMEEQARVLSHDG
jgi:hypothetical protein